MATGARVGVAMMVLMAVAACGASNETKGKRPNAPFGIAKGDLIPDINIGSTPDAMGYAVMRDVPKPEEPFRDYAVIVRENIGVCAVTAVSGNFAVSNVATVKERLKAAGARIAGTYGAPAHTIDRCDDKQLCKPSGWSQSLAQGVREYGAVWGGADKPVNADIQEIRLSARTNELMEPFVRVDYLFTNYAACKSAAAVPGGAARAAGGPKIVAPPASNRPLMPVPVSR